MNSNTDIEELRNILEKYDDKVMFSGGASRRAWKNKRFNEVNTFIQQKVIEARIDEVESQMDNYSFLPNDAGGLANRNIRLKKLQVQLNHNKKGKYER